MKKTPCACLFLGICAVFTAAYAQQEEKITITTYYPSSSGVYHTIRLYPGNAPADPKPGQLYYNGTTDKVQYRNKTSWVNLTGTGVSDDWKQLENRTSIPAGATPGRIYFNFTQKMPMYLNKENKWVNWTGKGLWDEAYMTWESPYFYLIRLFNSTNRRVGIGTKTPKSPFHVNINEESGPFEQERVGIFTTSRNCTGKSQSMYFSMFPEGTYKPYLDSTSLVSVPKGNLMATTADNTRSVSFNVGGYNTSVSEVMVLTNPGGEDRPSPRVGIGNATPPFALFVDSKEDNTTAFGVRGKRSGLKSGIGTITPYNDSVWITYGCYLKNNTWKNDRYEFPAGTFNTRGAAFVLKPDEGAIWYSYDTNGISGDKKNVTSWNVAPGRLLWNLAGAINCPSSRILKENFTPLDPQEFIRKIDELEVTRWNFKNTPGSLAHIGPVAEDFNRIFELDSSHNSFALSDSAGVALAGVKVLNGRIKIQQRLIKELKAELKDLESQLSRKGGLL